MAHVLLVYATTEGQTAKIAQYIAAEGPASGIPCGWLKRAIMKPISKREGGSTDTSSDHEYTDRNQVTRFAERFFKELVS